MIAAEIKMHVDPLLYSHLTDRRIINMLMFLPNPQQLCYFVAVVTSHVSYTVTSVPVMTDYCTSSPTVASNCDNMKI